MIDIHVLAFITPSRRYVYAIHKSAALLFLSIHHIQHDIVHAMALFFGSKVLIYAAVGSNLQKTVTNERFPDLNLPVLARRRIIAGFYAASSVVWLRFNI